MVWYVASFGNKNVASSYLESLFLSVKMWNGSKKHLWRHVGQAEYCENAEILEMFECLVFNRENSLVTFSQALLY